MYYLLDVVACSALAGETSHFLNGALEIAKTLEKKNFVCFTESVCLFNLYSTYTNHRATLTRLPRPIAADFSSFEIDVAQN